LDQWYSFEVFLSDRVEFRPDFKGFRLLDQDGKNYVHASRDTENRLRAKAAIYL